MKNAVICGAGKMGIAIGYAMKKLGFNLLVVEKDQENINRFKLLNGDCDSYFDYNEIKSNADIVISALPYTENVELASWAIANKLRYCDLGGSVPVSKKIKDLSQSAKNPVMTDLGLAPGWINLIAEELYKQLPKADTVKMMVGGIPAKPVQEDPLNYIETWSIEGLLNEYVDYCELLEDGNYLTVKGLSGIENVVIDSLELEAFCTSGASASSIFVMKERGVKNCFYKTLRWRGHANLMKYLLSIKDKNIIRQCLKKSNEYHTKDMVVMTAIVSKNNDIKLQKTIRINADSRFTAMQIATAFPLAAAAKEIADGKLDDYKYVTYADLDMLSFNKNLDILM